MLQGKKLTLRAWRESDIEPLILLRNDVALQAQLMTQPRPNSAETVRKWLLEKSAREDGVFFVVANGSDNNAVGYIQVINFNLLHGVGEFGICLSPTIQRTGYGREAFGLLEAYLRNTFATRKLVAHALAQNVAAIAFHRQCGFSEVGRFTRHFFLNATYNDVVVMEKHLAP